MSEYWCSQYIKTRIKNIKLHCRGKFYQAHNFEKEFLQRIKDAPLRQEWVLLVW